MKKRINILVTGGGTGGHVFPALAIANELKNRSEKYNFLFVGAYDRMEMQKVPKEGYKIKGLWISGFHRKSTFRNILFPIKLIVSLIQSFFIIIKFRPKIIIGTGGFASGAIGAVGTFLKIPLVIQEQNSSPGVTNKLLAKKAAKIFVAYESLGKYFGKNKIRVFGNPVRRDILIKSNLNTDVHEKYGLSKEIQTVLVLGGSLGARRINEMICDRLEWFKSKNLQIVWQTGKLYYSEYKKHECDSIKVVSFIDDMNLAFSVSDIIISRAGALAISELCIVGKPVIFIPSPNVAEDHQTKNAKILSDKNAAKLIIQSEIDNKFDECLSEILENKEIQNELSKNIGKLAFPNSTEKIVNEIEELINGN